MPSVSLALLAPILAAGGVIGTYSAAHPIKNAPDTVPVVTTPQKACVTDADVASAARYAKTRPGSVSFAIYEHGALRSLHGGVPYRSASLVKAMLLVADLRRHANSGAALSSSDRARLGNMIHVSDNVAATATFNIVGAPAVRSVAHLVGMRHYSVGYGWGTSQLTASDQARLWGRLDSVLPGTYRAYGRRLLGSIATFQTWGGAPVARRHGYKTLFKSGWLPQPGGWVVHQGLHLERGTCQLGIAVLTGRQPTMGTGIESIHGVAARLLD